MKANQNQAKKDAAQAQREQAEALARDILGLVTKMPADFQEWSVGRSVEFKRVAHEAWKAAINPAPKLPVIQAKHAALLCFYGVRS